MITRPPAPRVPEDGPFRIDAARQVGISEKMLRGPRFRQVFRGVYVAAEVPDSLSLRVAAARLLLPAEAVFSHHTAADLRNLPVPADNNIHALVRHGTARTRIPGVVAHQTSHPGRVWSCSGEGVTSAERTFLDLGDCLGLVELVILGDAMVRQGSTTLDELKAATFQARRPGVRLSRRAATLVRARVDSPMETRVRLLLVFAGLPCPAPAYEIFGEPGEWVATVDLAYPEQKIVLEYDGDLHRTSKRKWRHDVAARERLRELGWKVILLTSDDVYARPQHTLWRVQGALHERRHPDVREDLDPVWETYFPGRRPGTDAW